MQIGRHPIVGFFLTLAGHRTRCLELVASGVIPDKRPDRAIALGEVVAPAQVQSGRIFASLVLPLNGRSLTLVGVSRTKARSFADAFNTTWTTVMRAQIDNQAEEIAAIGQAVEQLSSPRYYPSACLLQPWMERADRLFAVIPPALPEAVISKDQQRDLAAIADFRRDPARARRVAAQRFIASELQQAGSFFDEIESNPLTPEQRLSIVTDEDATLVLAGAGSGKTSVIVAKAVYLIERGIRKPEEILLMAFAKEAAAEMKERIGQRVGAAVDARTFHALAYDIIKQVEGSAPALAESASDQRAYTALLREIVMEQAAQDSEIAHDLAWWFGKFFIPHRNAWDFKTRHEYFTYIKTHELRTLQGERVRSFEELEIANWLYLNGVAYEYEPDYEHPLPNTGRRNYTPDFRLTQSGVYLEHFGVRKERRANGQEHLVTAPGIDRDEYLRGMQWKHEVHAEHGTTLIATYSYERDMAGGLIGALERKIAPHVKLAPLPLGQVFERLKEMGQIDSFTGMLGTFLKHFKGAGLTIDDCKARSDSSQLDSRGAAFLKVFEPIFAEYQSRLGQRIDFEDMVVRATDHVASGRYRSPFRHLLVDEFQDISRGRANLLQALKAQHADARIFAVGDDWQSIYRFAGSDVHLMRSFGKEFGGHFAGKNGIHEKVDLGRTFRSVDRITMAARTFVLKNPAQIIKDVVPAGTSLVPAIRVAWYGKDEDDDALDNVLRSIADQAPGGKGKRASVLLLGRYSHVCPQDMAALKKGQPRLSIAFKTIHAAKGLEADHIVILRANSGRLGLPSEIVDDPILDLVLPAPESFHHAEERRVFYVALTRARKSVTILSWRDYPSAFVTELLAGATYGAVELGDENMPSHRCESCGGRMIARSSYQSGRRFVCEHGWLCGTRLPACPVCKSDIPVRQPDDPSTNRCRCGANLPGCPDCKNGWMVERKGKYGQFLGCVNYPGCSGTKPLKGG